MTTLIEDLKYHQETRTTFPGLTEDTAWSILSRMAS
jgi:hypothetical protein